MISDADRFRELACRFAALDVPCQENAVVVDAAVVHRLLDQLNSLSLYGQTVVDHALGERLLEAGVTLVSSAPPPTDHLITKFSSLVVNLLKGQKLSNEALVVTLVEYHVTILRRHAAWVRPYVLSSLGAVLLSGANTAATGQSFLLKSLDELIGVDGLLLQLAGSADDVETRRCALKCLEHLALGWGNRLRKDGIRRSLAVFVENFRCGHSPPPDKIEHCTNLVSYLVGLRNIVIGLRMSDVAALGELLAVLKSLMFYGLLEYSGLPSVDCLYPSPLSQSHLADAVKANQPSSPGSKNSRNSRTKRWSASQRGRSGCDVESAYADDRAPRSSSGSRYQSSWTKAGNSETECWDAEVLRSLQSRVRLRAIAALTALFEVVNRKITFGYWSSFLPSDDVAGASAARGTLVCVFLKDPAPKVRCGALSLLKVMLEGSKQFLGLADDRDRCKAASFMALSQTLASMVRGLQRALILALVSETSTPVLTQVLLCVAALVQAVQIQRLAPDFVAKFARHLKPMIDHSESNVSVAALTAFGMIASVEPALPEVSNVLGDGHGGSWLIDVCADNVIRRGVRSTPLPVRIESLQVLAALARVHFALVRNRLSVVVGVVKSGLDDKDASVNLHSAKLLEEFGRSFASVSSDGASFQLVEEIYRSLLAVMSAPRDGLDNSVLLAKFCDCLSTMSADVISLLPVHQRILCKTSLLGLGRDEDRGVKAAAVRALGVFVLHESIREDCEFLADVLHVVIPAFTEDPSADVRSKAAWTIANVTDALVLGRECDGRSFLDQVIDDQLLLRLCTAVLHGTTPSSDGNDRVRSNTVRALGNLLRYFGSEHLLEVDFAEMARKSIEALHTSASTGANMKVRWNACYALGNAFRNRLLLKREDSDGLTTTTVTVSGDVLLALSVVAKECKNFKVRINAAAALAVPIQAESYDDCPMATIVGNLLVGLDNIQASMDFVEYQHRDNLVEQLCTSVCHLIGLLRPSDVDSVSSVVEAYVELLRCHLGRCVERRRGDADAGETKKPSEFVAIHDAAISHLAVLESTAFPSDSLEKLIGAFTVSRSSWID